VFAPETSNVKGQNRAKICPKKIEKSRFLELDCLNFNQIWREARGHPTRRLCQFLLKKNVLGQRQAIGKEIFFVGG